MLPTKFDLTGNVDRGGLSHRVHPCSEAGASPVSQPSAAMSVPMVRLIWDLSIPIASFL